MGGSWGGGAAWEEATQWRTGTKVSKKSSKEIEKILDKKRYILSISLLLTQIQGQKCQVYVTSEKKTF